jgi:hypothetical protein
MMNWRALLSSPGLCKPVQMHDCSYSGAGQRRNEAALALRRSKQIAAVREVKAQL